MRSPSLSQALSRLAVAFCFLGFGIWELISPITWTSYVPAFVQNFLDPVILVLVHGIVLTVSGLAVFSGWKSRFFTGLSALIMLEICIEIFLQEGFSDIFIRDMAIFLFIAAMVAQTFERESVA